MNLRKSLLTSLAALALAVAAANAQPIVLYSYDFSDTGVLNGKAADTSGATLAQHAQYGTINGETWTASTLFQGDGTYDGTTVGERSSGTLSFTPQNGYVYTLSVTTNIDIATNATGFHTAGFFANNNYSADPIANGGGSVWGLTRPNHPTATYQQLFLDLNGGNNDPVATTAEGNFDSTAPSTLTFILDTTGGTGDWSAEWLVSGVSQRTVADLGAVSINSVGIGALYAAAGTAAFQSLELSVIPEPSSAMLLGLAGLSLLTLRRRR